MYYYLFSKKKTHKSRFTETGKVSEYFNSTSLSPLIRELYYLNIQSKYFSEIPFRPMFFFIIIISYKTTHPRHDVPFDIFHDIIPIFASFWSSAWNQISKVARLYVRCDSSLRNSFKIIGNVVYHFTTSPSELGSVHCTILERKLRRFLPPLCFFCFRSGACRAVEIITQLKIIMEKKWSNFVHESKNIKRNLDQKKKKRKPEMGFFEIQMKAFNMNTLYELLDLKEKVIHICGHNFCEIAVYNIWFKLYRTRFT